MQFTGVCAENMTEILVSPDTVSGFKVVDVEGNDVSEALNEPLTLKTPEGEEPQLAVKPIPTEVTTILKFQFTVTGAKAVTTIVSFSEGGNPSSIEQPVRSLLIIHFDISSI